MITSSSKISALRNHFHLTQHASLLHTSAAAIDASISLLNLLQLSIRTHSLNLIHQAHAKAHRVGLTHHPLIAQKLISSCCQLHRPIEARRVFDSLPVKNTHICNALLSGYGKNDCFVEASRVFREMCRDGVVFGCADEFTYSIMFRILGGFGEVLCGRMVQGRGVKSGVVSDAVVGNSLMSMYARCGQFGDCLQVFDGMPIRNVSSWNALISCYVKVSVEDGSGSLSGYGLWDFVKGIRDEGLRLDAFTVSALLPLCDDCRRGRELHAYVVRNGLDLSNGMEDDVRLGCCLIDMYSKNGRVGLGRRVFDKLKCKNVFTWTAVFNGYVHCGAFDEALLLFREMQWRDGVRPNKVSLVAILPACSSVAGLLGGKQIHGFAVRREINRELSLCNALIDVYSKCGSLCYATHVFEHECIDKDAISWSSIISGYGLHGQGRNAVILFDKMLQKGIVPAASVVVGVLSACCKSGLINDGIRIYDLVVTNYKIKPTVEMCSCMGDMFGRLGELNRALDFIKSMPVEPGPSIWGALFCASAQHGNTEVQEVAYKALIQLEPDNSSNYISLSNLYAASKKWDVVAQVRTVMKERGLRKVPGCSWISINSATHSFFVADKSHPCSDLIYVMLDELVSAMKLTCYEPDFVYVMEALE